LVNIVVDVLLIFGISKYDCVDKPFKLVNIVVDVLLIFGISKYDWVDKLYKLVNIVVDVLLIFGISKYDCVDKPFKLVFKLKIDTPEAVIFPIALNVLEHVEAFWKIEEPLTNNVLSIVTLLLNMVVPDIYNDDKNVEALLTINVLYVVLLFTIPNAVVKFDIILDVVVFKLNNDIPDALTSPDIFRLLKNVELLLIFKLPIHDILL